MDWNFLDNIKPMHGKPYPTEHASRLRNPEDFKDKPDWADGQQFARTSGGKCILPGAGMITIPKSIDLIWGQLPEQTGSESAVQALRFPIDTWTSEEAKTFLKDHKIKYISFEPATSGKALFKDFKSEIKDLDEAKGIVTIYVNAFNNIDSDRDISMPGSFDKTINEGIKRIKHLKDHDRYQLLGLPIEMKADDFGLRVVSAMNLKKQFVKDTFEDYRFFADYKRTLEHSIGYNVVKWETDSTTGITKIYEYKLYEYSTLSFLGANPETMLVDLKNSENTTLLQNMLKNGNYTDERCKLLEFLLTIDEDKLQQLKDSLTHEPGHPTRQNEPKQLNYNYLINHLKL